MGKISKAKCQIKHCKRRALERYGVMLSRRQIADLVSQIQTGKAKFIERQSHRVSKFLVHLGERDISCIYDNKRKTLVTFLPRGEECSNR